MNRKTGLEFFYLDVDFFNDEKIQFVSARFGAKGEAVTLRLLCKIYRQGYYTAWDDDAALLLAKGVVDIGQHSCVRDVVYELVKRGFFDKGIFDSFGILTSRGIQRRYVEATWRRKDVKMRRELLLVDVSGFPHIVIADQNVDILSQNVNILPQSKVKESKVKESKKHICPPAVRQAGVCVIAKNSSDKEIEAAFNTLWPKVLRKIGKQEALLAFASAIKEGVAYDAISAGLDAYNAAEKAKGTELKHIKGGGGWFRDRRWEDDHPAPGAFPKPAAKSKFHNFDQREYDFDALERLERDSQYRELAREGATGLPLLSDGERAALLERVEDSQKRGKT